MMASMAAAISLDERLPPPATRPSRVADYREAWS